MKLLPSFAKKDLSKTRYTRLLATLLSLILAFAVIDQYIIILALFFLIILFIVKTFNLSKKVFYGYVTIAVISFICGLIYHLNLFAQLDTSFMIFHLLTDIIFITLAIVVISRRIFNSEKVRADTIRGGICVYLLIGLLWSEFYQLLLITNIATFSFNPDLNLTEFNNKLTYLFYFSFTTLTTLGYGDILPTDKLSMVIANLEAIAGQMYPTVFIAYLVGLYTADRITAKEEQKETND